MRTVPVALGARSYDVHVGEGALPKAAGLVPDIDGCERVAIVSDANVDRAWGDSATEAFAPLGSTGEVERLVVDAGETSKSMQRVGRLLEEMASRKVRRSDLLVALGGGMVGDLAGFAASIYQRGMALVQAPTSLLAQVDAAVGGKTAVNLTAGKNLAGTFHQPRAVVAGVRRDDRVDVPQEIAGGEAGDREDLLERVAAQNAEPVITDTARVVSSALGPAI